MQLEVINYELEDVKQWLHIVGDEAFVDIGNGWPSYKRAFESILKKSDIAIQAGGYCGIFPRMLSSMFKRVYTFEPDPVNFYCLSYNTPTNNVMRYQAALDMEHKPIAMQYMHPTNAGMKRVQDASDGIIPTLCIDDLNLPDCDLIMLDIEGSEYKALMGGLKTIEKFRPVISVEDTNSEIETMLSQFGYKGYTTVYRDTIYAV